MWLCASEYFLCLFECCSGVFLGECVLSQEIGLGVGRCVCKLVLTTARLVSVWMKVNRVPEMKT